MTSACQVVVTKAKLLVTLLGHSEGGISADRGVGCGNSSESW